MTQFENVYEDKTRFVIVLFALIAMIVLFYIANTFTPELGTENRVMQASERCLESNGGWATRYNRDGRIDGFVCTLSYPQFNMPPPYR